MNSLPKVLIVSRGVWDDAGTASTLSNIFQNYDSEMLSQIYIETKKPNTRLCQNFFQISEFSLIKKIYKWKTKSGRRVDATYAANTDVARKEAKTMQYVREHRSFAFKILRELLWHLNGWKSEELRSFIQEENPDVLWLTGSPLILMNRLSQYVVKQSGKPYCIYEMDDVYSYKNCGNNPCNYIYRFFLRRRVEKLIKGASQVFVISPKMKREFDTFFGINSIVLTKGIDFTHRSFRDVKPAKPVNMVYLGNLLYGRLSTIEKLAFALDEINCLTKRIILTIYTGSRISDAVKENLTKNGNVIFHEPVPYMFVEGIIIQSDVVLFAESFEEKKKNTARLSFSTKLTDYFAGGKCLLAIGPEDIAPMEYLINNDAAVTVTSEQEILIRLEYLLNPGTIELYARKAYDCGLRNHDKHILDKTVFGILSGIANNT